MPLQNALVMAIQSDPGRVRTNNEDAVYVDPAAGLAILADGMGGYSAGEVASKMAIDTLSQGVGGAVKNQQSKLAGITPGSEESLAWRILRDHIALANDAIYHQAQQPQFREMATTLVLALFYDNRLTVAHLGDSRLYRLRDGKFQPVTKDHSLWQECIDAGLPPPKHLKNLVTRALGKEPSGKRLPISEPEIHDYDVQPGDVFLLCSDGMYDMVHDEDIALPLEMLANNLPLAAARLIQMANENGGKDNVSVVLIRAKSAFPQRGITSRLKELIGV